MELEPITREEMYLAAAAGHSVTPPEPRTRKEIFLSKLAGIDVETPTAYTRQERFIEMAAVAQNACVIEPLEITENGTYTAPDGVDGYSPVTVEVAGSGGGSLPAGAYWESLDIPYPSLNLQSWFSFQGELYAFIGSYTTNCDITSISKYSNGTWSSVVSGINITFANPDNVPFVEYNGKIHLYGSDSKSHYVFDGSTITRMNEIPDRLVDNSMFVQDGLLKAYSYANGKAYFWDESTDTWTEEATPGSNDAYYEFFNISGVIYVYGSNKFYTYSDGVLSEIWSVTESPDTQMVFGDSIIATIGQKDKPLAIYSFNPITKLREKICTMPQYKRNISLFEYDGKICWFPYCGGVQFTALALHEVTE